MTSAMEQAPFILAGKRNMLAHEVLQLYKTRKEIREILILRSRSEIFLCRADEFLYVFCSSFSDTNAAASTSGSPETEVHLKNILLFPFRVMKLQECNTTDEERILFLTNDGAIWNIGLLDILGSNGKEEARCHMKRQDDSNDIFGALLQPQQPPVAAKKDGKLKSRWPIKVDETYRVLQEADISDFFVINGEVTIVRVTNKSIEIHGLKFLNCGVECRPLLTILDGISDLCVKVPPMYMYMNIICQKNNLTQASGVIELERNLFSSMFSLTNALQRSLIFIYGDEKGNTCMFPFAIGMQEGAVLNYSDSANVFCSMGQPLIAILYSTIKEFAVFGTETVSARDRDAIDKSIASIKGAFKKEIVLVLVGRLGKVVIILHKSEECMMSIFNTCHVSGPVLSASTLDDFFIYGTGDSLHVSKMIISVHVEDRKRLSIFPSLQPVYSIVLPIISISKTIIAKRDSKLDFYCADANGWILKVIIDSTYENVETGDISSNINYLLSTLESLQKDFNGWQSMVAKQNSVLGELQIAASLTANVMQSTRDGKFGLKMTKPSVYCCIKSISIGTDGVLYLDISVHNLPDYALQSNWFLQLVGKARQKTSNSLYGSLKKFSKIVALHSFQSKTVMQWKNSINIVELQIFLPIEIEFKLAIPCYKFCSIGLETAEMMERSCIILPLNSLVITVLDIAHIYDCQFLKEEASENYPICYSQHGTCVCHFCSVLPVFSSIECRQYSFENTPLKELIVLSVPPLALQCFLQDEEQNATEGFVKVLIAHLFPYNSYTSAVEFDSSLLLVLPCKQQIRISLVYDSCDGSNVNTNVPKLQLKGYCLPLLLAMYSAIFVRLKSETEPRQHHKYRVPHGANTHYNIEKMQKRLQELLPPDNFLKAQECAEEIISMLIGLRSTSSL